MEHFGSAPHPGRHPLVTADETQRRNRFRLRRRPNHRAPICFEMIVPGDRLNDSRFYSDFANDGTPIHLARDQGLLPSVSHQDRIGRPRYRADLQEGFGLNLNWFIRQSLVAPGAIAGQRLITWSCTYS